jgi:hypothetical protein
MQCPACKKVPLITVEYAEVELDYCENCQGVWLDAGELELLMTGDAALPALTDVPSGGGTRRRCPRCSKKMAQRTSGGESSVEVDVCPRGCGLWLDRGELRQLLEHGGGFDAAGGLAAWLRDVFGCAADE